ncbi:MAG: 5-oxopent-3-ene-1,2,5-tricarboxylate decarboxylase [Pseudonocardiaceae bacterium]|nr:5-oxopent-3-ene-1,2,5-tricarboxylate decarboxylase [Pseudonocardiaceae bacterium]
MKLARYRLIDGRTSFGVVTGAQVTALDHRIPSFEALAAAPSTGLPQRGDPHCDLAEVAWEPPIGTHAKIVCVGYNYATHARETGTQLPEWPTLFTRYPDSLVGSGQPVVRPTDTDSLDWEGEVAVVIGAPARRVPSHAAADYIAGFTCLAENSVREWQQHSTQATAGKNWAASGACGPWLVTSDEVGEEPMELTTRLNGQVMQHDTTAHLTFSFAHLISYISAFTPLRAGDVIATGTPSGIGLRREPPRYLRPGDELEVEVERVGLLSHAVIDEAGATPVETP